jgi:hypothetical protein
LEGPTSKRLRPKYPEKSQEASERRDLIKMQLRRVERKKEMKMRTKALRSK